MIPTVIADPPPPPPPPAIPAVVHVAVDPVLPDPLPVVDPVPADPPEVVDPPGVPAPVVLPAEPPAEPPVDVPVAEHGSPASSDEPTGFGSPTPDNIPSSESSSEDDAAFQTPMVGARPGDAGLLPFRKYMQADFQPTVLLDVLDTPVAGPSKQPDRVGLTEQFREFARAMKELSTSPETSDHADPTESAPSTPEDKSDHTTPDKDHSHQSSSGKESSPDEYHPTNVPKGSLCRSKKKPTTPAAGQRPRTRSHVKETQVPLMPPLEKPARGKQVKARHHAKNNSSSPVDVTGTRRKRSAPGTRTRTTSETRLSEEEERAAKKSFASAKKVFSPVKFYKKGSK